jgi:hypothetical protein
MWKKFRDEPPFFPHCAPVDLWILLQRDGQESPRRWKPALSGGRMSQGNACYLYTFSAQYY